MKTSGLEIGNLRFGPVGGLKIENYCSRRTLKNGYLKLGTVFLAFVVFLFVAFPSSSVASWPSETIDAPRFFDELGPRAIAVDKVTNYPHIVFGGDHLHHAYFNGTAWQYEVIDNSSAVGAYTSIAVDSNNKIHVSYYGRVNNNTTALKYATNASGSWVTTIVDSKTSGVGGMGEYTSIAVDTNNKIHISYLDFEQYKIKYATNAAGSWITSVIDSAADLYASLAVDSNNKVHISYYGNTLTNLKYATNVSGSWVISTVDSASTGICDGGPSIAIDPNTTAKFFINPRRMPTTFFYVSDKRHSFSLYGSLLFPMHRLL